MILFITAAIPNKHNSSVYVGSTPMKVIGSSTPAQVELTSVASYILQTYLY